MRTVTTYRLARQVQTCTCRDTLTLGLRGRLLGLVLGVFELEVRKRRVALIKAQVDDAGRSITLLGDMDLGDVLVFGRRRVVVVVAIDEGDNVRLLLDTARLPQIRQQRALIVA